MLWLLPHDHLGVMGTRGKRLMSRVCGVGSQYVDFTMKERDSTVM